MMFEEISMQHSLKALLDDIIPVLEDCEVTGICSDSRQVQAGDLFLAYPGFSVDGRSFIQQALDKGAKAICYCNADGYYFNTSNLYVLGVPKLNQYLSLIADRFYDSPSSKMYCVGITGTNGKTTTAYMLMQAYHLLGDMPAYIGTLGFCTELNNIQASNNTTPDPLFLQKKLAEYASQGISHLAMEVSSHALDQYRCQALQFSQAIFTNLSHEHLDYHADMQDYARAKAKLFQNPYIKQAIVNADDAWSIEMSDAIHPQAELYTYGCAKKSDITIRSHSSSLEGIHIECSTPWGKASIINKHILGEFNAYNLITVLTSLCAQGYSLDEVCDVLSSLKPVPGRMQVVATKPMVIVDFAHTPDALENVLSTVSSLTSGKVITVFGCGGDRDVEKRPVMGFIADKNSDFVIISNDNPRTEDPMLIAKSIAKGVTKKNKLNIVLDRACAIETALALCNPQDVVVIAGKGHEAYQQFATERIEFSDEAIAKSLHEKLTL
jgi:UDP-N-acetylmuramoyl-L-alanyl-D-glutamate--2,6-diaminopimelate ligase